MKKLVPCQGCARELDPTAKVCPGCGRPDPTKKPASAKNVVIGLLAIVVVIYFIGSSGGSSTPTASTSAPVASKPEAPPIEVTAMELWRRYQANEAAADDAFKGNKLHVTGVIQSIDKDFTNHIVLQLRTGNEFMNVHAQLDESSGRGASSLSKRQTVSLTCVGSTMIIGSPTLDDCSF